MPLGAGRPGSFCGKQVMPSHSKGSGSADSKGPLKLAAAILCLVVAGGLLAYNYFGWGDKPPPPPPMKAEEKTIVDDSKKELEKQKAVRQQEMEAMPEEKRKRVTGSS